MADYNFDNTADPMEVFFALLHEHDLNNPFMLEFKERVFGPLVSKFSNIVSESNIQIDEKGIGETFTAEIKRIIEDTSPKTKESIQNSVFDKLNITNKLELSGILDKQTRALPPPLPVAKDDNQFESAFQPSNELAIKSFSERALDQLDSILDKSNVFRPRKDMTSEGGDQTSGLLSKFTNMFGGKSKGPIFGKGKAPLGMNSLFANMFVSPGAAALAAKHLATTGPIAALIAGVIWTAYEGVKGFFKADDWGTGKVSAIFGGLLGGTDASGSWAGAGKTAARYALIGATSGLVGGPIGGLLGAAIGGILGTVMGFIGGKNIAKAFDKLQTFISIIPSKFMEAFEEHGIFGVFELIASLPGKVDKFIRKGIAVVLPQYVKDLIGLNDDGSITQGGISRFFEEHGGFMGGLGAIGSIIKTNVKQMVANIYPQYIKDLIGMGPDGSIDFSKSLIMTEMGEKGFVGSIAALGSHIGAGVMQMIANLYPQYIKELIGMDDKGNINLANSLALSTFEEKGFVGGLQEIGNHIARGVSATVYNVLPEFLQSLTTIDSDGMIQLKSIDDIKGALGQTKIGKLIGDIDTDKIKDSVKGVFKGKDALTDEQQMKFSKQLQQTIDRLSSIEVSISDEDKELYLKRFNAQTLNAREIKRLKELNKLEKSGEQVKKSEKMTTEVSTKQPFEDYIIDDGKARAFSEDDKIMGFKDGGPIDLVFQSMEKAMNSMNERFAALISLQTQNNSLVAAGSKAGPDKGLEKAVPPFAGVSRDPAYLNKGRVWDQMRGSGMLVVTG